MRDNNNILHYQKVKNYTIVIIHNMCTNNAAKLCDDFMYDNSINVFNVDEMK